MEAAHSSQQGPLGLLGQGSVLEPGSQEQIWPFAGRASSGIDRCTRLPLSAACWQLGPPQSKDTSSSGLMHTVRGLLPLLTCPPARLHVLSRGREKRKELLSDRLHSRGAGRPGLGLLHVCIPGGQAESYGLRAPGCQLSAGYSPVLVPEHWLVRAAAETPRWPRVNALS